MNSARDAGPKKKGQKRRRDPNGALVNVWIASVSSLSPLFLFFFFGKVNFHVICTVQWVSCTIYGTHKPLFSTKLSLKMGPTTLFTYLKIILLQCFQFSTK